MTKFLLDSGDPIEYKEIAALLKEKGSELWGSTTNPSLIAKKLAGQKATQEQAFSVLQKQIIQEILAIVPGAVSGEVYASHKTTADEMIKQGMEVASWDPRVVVKLPTTIEGFKARTALRKLGICINNTLVFSQQQTFAIALHEKIMIDSFGKPKTPSTGQWPCFVSPFLGRLDDIGQDGLSMMEHAISMILEHFPPGIVWMLEASVRNATHMKKGVDLNVDLITAPAKVYQEWFAMDDSSRRTIPSDNKTLQEIPAWQPTQELLSVDSLDSFMKYILDGTLDISHSLTDAGIDKFVADWNQIIVS